MRTPREWLVCVTHTTYEELQDARNIVVFMRAHGAPGCWAKSCLWCRGFHVLGPYDRDRQRAIWFAISVASLVLAAVGTSFIHDLLWFFAYEIIGMLVVAAGIFWQYGRL